MAAAFAFLARTELTGTHWNDTAAWFRFGPIVMIVPITGIVMVVVAMFHVRVLRLLVRQRRIMKTGVMIVHAEGAGMMQTTPEHGVDQQCEGSRQPAYSHQNKTSSREPTIIIGHELRFAQFKDASPQ